MFLELYVVRLTRTSDDGSPINGMWRKQRWYNGESLYQTFREAKLVRSRVGGNIIPFSESNLFKALTEDVQDAIVKVQNLKLEDLQRRLDDAHAKLQEKESIVGVEETHEPVEEVDLTETILDEDD